MMNSRAVCALLICGLLATGLIDVNVQAQKPEKKSITMEWPRGESLHVVFWDWYGWLTKTETLDYVHIALQIAKNKSEAKHVEQLLAEYDQKCAAASKLLGDTKNSQDITVYVNILEHQNDILKSFLEAQKVYESLSNYIRNNLSLLQKIDPAAYTKATANFKNEQVNREKFDQFKKKITSLQQQFKEWSDAHKKQIAELKSINDACKRELETYPVYQDFQKTLKTAGRSAADKYLDQISELQTKLAQKYFSGLDPQSDVMKILFYFTSSIPNLFYDAEWLIKTPQYINGAEALAAIVEAIEYLLQSLSDLSQKVSIKDKTVAAQ